VAGSVTASTPDRRARALALGGFVLVRALGLVALAVGGSLSGLSAHERLTRWDAQWYVHIARHGYGMTKVVPDGRHLSDLAFFPLYPLLERLVHTVTRLPFADAGLLVTALASLATALVLHDLGTRLYGVRAGLVLVLLWAAVPVGVVESMAYSEALFTLLAAGACLAVVRDKWVVAGLLASLAGLTRPVGVAVVAGIGVAVLVRVLRRDAGWQVWAGAVMAPLGWLGYLLWVGARVGDPLGYFTVAGRWGNSFDGGAAYGGWVLGFLTGSWPAPLLGLLLLAGTAAVVWLVWLGVTDRQPPVLVAYTATLVLLAFTSSGYFGSKPRYLLPAFGLLVPLAVRLSRARPAVTWPVLGALTAVASVYGAVWLLGPGPP